MYSFRNDYCVMAHPQVMASLNRIACEQNAGYGLDAHCANAARMIRERFSCRTAEVFFIPGGTQCNTIVLSHLLRPYQAVICADTGHINVHETGAIESTGHKVIGVPSRDGKVTAGMVDRVLRTHTDEHYVQPAAVYISNPTEIGTVYSKTELSALSNFCREKGLFLYLDGARLPMALAVKGNDLYPSELAGLTDAFYIGGTKCGAMFGEALVVVDERLKKDLRCSIKQRGGMAAKGWLMGAQFEALLTDDLYFHAASHAVQMANKFRTAFAEMGIRMLSDSPTNQLFPIVPEAWLPRIDAEYATEFWSREADGICIRFVTAWSTEEGEVDRCIAFLKGFKA